MVCPNKKTVSSKKFKRWTPRWEDGSLHAIVRSLNFLSFLHAGSTKPTNLHWLGGSTINMHKLRSLSSLRGRTSAIYALQAERSAAARRAVYSAHMLTGCWLVPACCKHTFFLCLKTTLSLLYISIDNWNNTVNKIILTSYISELLLNLQCSTILMGTYLSCFISLSVLRESYKATSRVSPI